MESPRSHEQSANSRELFTAQDVDAVLNLVQSKQLKKIFVVGAMGSGKSSFAEALSRSTNLPNIELDQYAQRYEQEVGSRSGDIRKTFAFAIAKQGDAYIVDHAELLGKDLESFADMVVLLNPRHEELRRSYEERKQRGATGDWLKFGPEELARFSTNIAQEFGELPGNVTYENTRTGVSVKVLTSRT